jgi:putative phage-type endonuclease
MVEIESTIYELTDEYIRENILEMADPNFHKNLLEHVDNTLFDMYESLDLCDQDDFDDISEFVGQIVEHYFAWITAYPIRQHKTSFRSCPSPDIQAMNQFQDQLKKKIAHLQSIPQQTQRTPEWYEFRHGLITASNLSKVFGSESQQNSLIYEKCQPLDQNAVANNSTHVNTQSPLHWGQKYEPVSVAVYQDMFCTTVSTEFGCIQHPVYPYIGASPDGIVVSATPNERFGRMVEVKNIVNREIDGIPSKAYWIQMQIQLEVCDLDECDFLETKFEQYPDADTFYQALDPVPAFGYKGVILYFVDLNLANQQPKYVYMPIEMGISGSREEIEKWIQETRQNMRSRGQWILYETQYWFLRELSCILVERNKAWFKMAQPKIAEIWNTILRERETGYEHRSAKKRTKSFDHTNIILEQGQNTNPDVKTVKTALSSSPFAQSFCLVKLDRDDIDSENNVIMQEPDEEKPLKLSDE